MLLILLQTCLVQTSYRASQYSGLYPIHHSSLYSSQYSSQNQNSSIQSSQYFSQGPDSVEFPVTSKPGVDNQVERRISNKTERRVSNKTERRISSKPERRISSKTERGISNKTERGISNKTERRISSKIDTSCVCGSRVEKILILECVGAYMRCEYVPSSKQLPYRCDFVQQEEEPW